MVPIELLVEAEGHYRAVVENLAEGVVVQDATGRIVSSNPAAQAILGLSVDELTGLTSVDARWDALHEDGSPFPGEKHPAAITLSTGQSVTDVVMGVRHSSGDVRWLVVNSRPLHDAAGDRLTGVVVSFRDVTDERRAEQALRDSEEYAHLTHARFQRLVDANIIGIVVENAAGDIIEANDYYLDLLGVTRDELERGALDWRAFTPPEWLPVGEHAIAELRERGVCTPYEKEYVRRDGRRVPVLLTDALLPGASPEIVAYVLDIGDRKRAEEALHQSEQEFQALAEAMPQMAWITRPDGWHTSFNQRWVEYTGLTLQESYGEGWSTPFHPDDRERALEAWRQATSTGDTYEVEVRLRRADGAYRWWLIRCVPLRDADGQILKWFGTCTDIDEIKQAATALQQTTRLYATLSQVNQAIVRVKEPDALYRAMCDVAVEFGEFALAWVGLLDEASGDVRPVAANGADLAHWPFEAVNIRGGAFRDGLVATAVRSHGVVTSEDVVTDERVSALGQIQGRDLHSVAAIPFRLRGETIGALVLVSRKTKLFEAASERSLLEEMGLDISFALDSMATEAERRLAEEARAESEQRYRGLFESSPVPMSLQEVVCDADGKPVDYRFLYVNPAFERFMITQAAKLVGHTIVEVAPQVNRAFVERAGWVALTGVPDRFEGFSVGLNRYHETTVFSPRQGQCVTHVMDVTERKLAEEALAAQAARLNVLADASKALTAVGQDYEVVPELVARLVSEAFGDVCRIRTLSDDGCRLDLAAIHSPDPGLTEGIRAVEAPSLDLAADLSPAAQVIRSGEPLLVPVITQEANRASPTPAFVPLLERFPPHSFIMVPMRTQDRVIGVLSLTRVQSSALSFTEDDLILAQELADRAALAISNARLLGQVRDELVERTRAEDEVRALNENLERLVEERTATLAAVNRELEAFSYSVSHDLRAPLRHIDAFGKRLLEDHASQLDAEARRVLGRVVANSNQMGILIDDLLAFSRVARKELDRRPVEMDRLVRSVCDDLRSGEPGRVIEFDVGTLCAAPGDQALLRQVWANLLGNAVKFTRHAERPRIEVRCERAAGVCRYTVRDNGAGFDATYADKLFQPFQRLHQASEFEGTGIGLAIVARIVQRHGGRVWAEGAPGAGATFGFSLPEEMEAT